ncbi:DinB family protein [Pseudodesulfovibrio sediminis]|uniref:DinB-like domain-containing protein n=1 Tax=Pseudodesulfovibrio sediminis TaxID=2810563 RepID=A0ABM7P3E1_9BACT|nr:DinB family protein [Pseudodesulfovibrio sediminis]BCS87296.1 hypothetical protein PSDVSF_05380 [Pseudodesulfovibrio sediminis]
MPSPEIENIIKSLEATPSILAGMVNSIPEDQHLLKRQPAFWSIAEHVAHLADVQSMLVERLTRILTEDKPEFIPFFPDAEEEEAPPIPAMAEALSTFSSGRKRQLALLKGINEKEWERTATHPEYTEYSIRILARHILMHDYWHMYRMEELWLTQDPYLTTG